jgi:hypothetical protein
MEGRAVRGVTQARVGTTDTSHREDAAQRRVFERAR